MVTAVVSDILEKPSFLSAGVPLRITHLTQKHLSTDVGGV